MMIWKFTDTVHISNHQWLHNSHMQHQNDVDNTFVELHCNVTFSLHFMIFLLQDGRNDHRVISRVIWNYHTEFIKIFRSLQHVFTKNLYNSSHQQRDQSISNQVPNGTLKWKGRHRSAQGPHNTISWTKIAKIDYLGCFRWMITNIIAIFIPVYIKTDRTH